MRKLSSIISALLVGVFLIGVLSVPMAAAAEGSQTISTTYSGGNNYAGNMFNVQVLSTSPVCIDSFDIHLDSSGASATVSVYYREGSYVGYESSSDGWALVGTKTVVSRGVGVATPLPIGGIWLTPGKTYGFYITVTNYGEGIPVMQYTNGTNEYTDANLKVICGIGKGTPDFIGQTYDPRTWNGTIHYSILTNDLLGTDPVEETYTGADLAQAFTDEFQQLATDKNGDILVSAEFSQNGSPVSEVTSVGTYDVKLTYSFDPLVSSVTWEQTIPGGAVVVKAPQDAPDAPTAQSKTDTSITLQPVAGGEYSIDGTNWQASNVFTGLSADTEYTLYVRLAETDSYIVSDSSAGTAVKTKMEAPAAPSAPTVQSKTASSVTLQPVTGGEYSIDGGAWQAGNVFEGLSPNTEYTFTVRLAETETVVASASSTGTAVRTDKLSTDAPAAPTVQSKTASSVTLQPVTGGEYSKDGTTWQTSNVFTGLTANTSYTFMVRYAENDTHLASPSSAGTTVTTDKLNQSPDTGDYSGLLLIMFLASAASLGTLTMLRVKHGHK